VAGVQACQNLLVSVIAADHPLVSQTIQALKVKGKPVVSYITDQSARDRAGYVGTDNWKLGRTAAWFIAQTTHGSGRVALFIGNHRYQCQDNLRRQFPLVCPGARKPPHP
jgi:LacI family transcriptional regulator